VSTQMKKISCIRSTTNVKSTNVSSTTLPITYSKGHTQSTQFEIQLPPILKVPTRLESFEPC